jgi:hypothetical protein
MSSPPKLTVQCDIVGHASPRWRGATSEASRTQNNEVLSKQRAEAFMKEFEAALTKELKNYQLRFLKDVSYAEDSQPDQTAVIGAQARGQLDSLPLAGGDRSNDDPKFRRTDITCRIARSVQDEMPTKVTRRWDRPTKSKFWYVSVGVSASVEAVVGFTLLRLKLRNWMGDEAEGLVSAVGGGAGLKYGLSPYSWSNEAPFSTPSEVGFDAFHGRRVRYTSAGLAVGVGYARSYLTFYGMGPDAASLYVGGWETGLEASAAISEGLLVLDVVPGDYKIEQFDITEWNTVRSDWITQHELSVFFESGKSTLQPKALSQAREFAAKLARDIRTQ